MLGGGLSTRLEENYQTVLTAYTFIACNLKDISPGAQSS